MNRIILLLIAFSLVFTGSISQTYTHTIYQDGNSLINRELDLTFFTKVLPEQSLEAMASACLIEDSLRCDVNLDSKVIYVNRSFEDMNLYYTIEVENEIPYSTYTLTVNQIPNDEFTYAIRDIMKKAGLETNDQELMKPIDLSESSEWKAKADQLESLGIEITYTVEMPGEIISAKAGDVVGEVEGSKVSFNAIEILKNPGPIVVKSRQLNSVYLLGIVLVLTVVILGALIIKKRRSRKTVNKKTEKRRRTRK